MTGPLTPPNRSSQDQGPDGHAGMPPWGEPWSGAREDRAPGLRAEIPPAILVLVVTTLFGLLLGALWFWLAPRVPLVSDGTAVFLKDTEGEEAIGADGTFVLLGLAFGLVSAVLVFLLRRRGGVPLVFGLAIGGLLGSVLAWKFGGLLGPTSDVVAHAKEVGKNVTFDAPLELAAKGALLAWPVAAMVVFLVLTAVFSPRDPEPRAEWLPPGDDRTWSSRED